MRGWAAIALLAGIAGQSSLSLADAEKLPAKTTVNPPATIVLQRLGDDAGRAVFLETSSIATKGDTVSAWTFGYERASGAAGWSKVAARCKATKIADTAKLQLGADFKVAARTGAAPEHAVETAADKVVFGQLCAAKRFASAGLTTLAAAADAGKQPARQMTEIVSAAADTQGPRPAPVWQVTLRSQQRIEAWSEQAKTTGGASVIGYAYRFRAPQKLPFDASRSYISAFFTLEVDCKGKQSRITSSLYLDADGVEVSRSAGDTAWSVMGSSDPIGAAGVHKCAGQLKPDGAGFAAEPVAAAKRFGQMLDAAGPASAGR